MVGGFIFIYNDGPAFTRFFTSGLFSYLEKFSLKSIAKFFAFSSHSILVSSENNNSYKGLCIISVVPVSENLLLLHIEMSKKLGD